MFDEQGAVKSHLIVDDNRWLGRKWATHVIGKCKWETFNLYVMCVHRKEKVILYWCSLLFCSVRFEMVVALGENSTSEKLLKSVWWADTICTVISCGHWISSA